MQKRSVFFPLFCIGACFFFTTCGLDEYYILSEPVTSYGTSITSTVTWDEWYVDFITNEVLNADYYPSKNAGFVFLGTGVYYKIYNSASVLESHRSQIENVNTQSNYSAAATKMIETYGYQPLDTYPSMDWTPFVACAERNQRVQFRLKSYSNASAAADFSALHRTNACIAFDGRYYGFAAGSTLIDSFAYDESAEQWLDGNNNPVSFDAITFLIPYRNIGQYSFDFFDDDENDSSHVRDREPQDGDVDYYYSSGVSTETYYVQLYAVAVGRDTNYTTSYSLVLDLGTIPIKKGE